LNDESLFLDLQVSDNWDVQFSVAARTLGQLPKSNNYFVLDAEAKSGELSTGKAGKAAIHYAIVAGNFGTFNALLPSYGGLNQMDEHGWALLSLAAYHGHDKIVRHLLELNAEEFVLGGQYVSDLSEMTMSINDRTSGNTTRT